MTNVATSSSAVTGTTTVTDSGPAAGVDLVGTPSGTGWTCTRVARGFSCTTTATPAIGAAFPDITAPATTTITNGTFLNIATVANPGDTVLSDNTDPANVVVGAVLPACIAGTTVGVQTAAVTASTPSLCPAGAAVGGFTTSVV